MCSTMSLPRALPQVSILITMQSMHQNAYGRVCTAAGKQAQLRDGGHSRANVQSIHREGVTLLLRREGVVQGTTPLCTHTQNIVEPASHGSVSTR